MALLVQLSEPWLADVGFGESFIEPLRLHDPTRQCQRGVAYQLRREGDRHLMLAGPMNGDLKPQYSFDLRPRVLADFAGMCKYHQTSPASHFTHKRVCTRITEDGRITLSDLRLIITRGGQRQEQSLASEDEFRSVLKLYFDIELT